MKKHAIVRTGRFSHASSRRFKRREKKTSPLLSVRVLKSFRKLVDEFLRPAAKAYLLSKPILSPGLLAHWITRCYGDFPTDTKRRRNHEKRIPMVGRHKSAAFVRCVSFELVLLDGGVCRFFLLTYHDKSSLGCGPWQIVR